jgi:hypothetical protein
MANHMKFASIPEIDKKLKTALDSFCKDPPNDDYQRGYMSALMEVAKNYLYWPEDHLVLTEARKVYNKSIRK